MSKKKQEPPKKTKDMIKELEEKAFGLKNKKQKATILKQIEALKLKDNEAKQEKLKKEAEKKRPVIQKIPIGADPKTIQCVNYLNKCCTEGDQCRFAHENVKKIDKVVEEDKTEKQKHVCQFLIDAINASEYNADWKCPFPNCKNIHRLVDIKNDGNVELCLEEYLELSRQSLTGTLTPLTAETFKKWKESKLKEEKEHRRKVEALSAGQKGIDMFKDRPDMFDDDEEAVDLDYNERCYSEEEEVEEALY